MLSTHYSSLRRITNRRCRRRRSWSLISSLTIFSKLRHGISLYISSFFTDFPSFARLFMRFLCSSSRTISLLSVVSSVLSSKTINGGAYSAAGYLISERSSVSLKLLIGAWLFVRMNSVVGFGFGSGVMQTAAVLEVLHGAIGTLWLFVIWLEWMSYELIDWLILFEILKGIVPSGFLSPLMQWSGRTHFILAIVGQINEVFTLWSALLVSWEDVSAKLAVWFCFHILSFSGPGFAVAGNNSCSLVYRRGEFDWSSLLYQSFTYDKAEKY